MPRTDVKFPSGDGSCTAWLYRPEGSEAAGGDVPCVVMGHGFSLTRHDGLALWAEAFAAAGVAALVYDFRHLGDSPGEPRQRFRMGHQLEDVRSAVAYARGLEGVDPERIVVWGFSMSGGHAVLTAAQDPRIAALLLVCPLLDGLARALKTPPALTAWILPRAITDAAGRHTTIPVTAQPGQRAAMTFPGEADGFARATPGSPWRNEISPGLFLTIATHRPVTKASKVRCPAFVGLGERDISVSDKAVVQFAERAPRAELHRYPHDHFDPFVGDGPQAWIADQVAFLERTVLDRGKAPAAA